MEGYSVLWCGGDVGIGKGCGGPGALAVAWCCHPYMQYHVGEPAQGCVWVRVHLMRRSNVEREVKSMVMFTFDRLFLMGFPLYCACVVVILFGVVTYYRVPGCNRECMFLSHVTESVL